MRKVFFVVVVIGIFLIGAMSSVFAESNEMNEQATGEMGVVVERNDAELNEKIDIEQLMLNVRGSTNVWDATYKNKYTVRKESLNMTAFLVEQSSRPYTTFKFKNTGKSSIAVVAYKGTVLGSRQIKAMTVGAGHTKTLTVTRTDTIKYGTINGQGNLSTLVYNVSAHNSSNKAISFSVKAIKYY